MDGGVTSNELQMIRDAVRANLESNWPAEKAVVLSEKSEQLAAIWRGLGQQGVLSLGAGPEGAGLSEALVVMEELDRAGCSATSFRLSNGRAVLESKVASADSVGRA